MRTVDTTALNAIANSQGEAFFRVHTWADLTAYNAAPTVPEQEWTTDKFEIKNTSAKASLISESNDYTVSDFTVFIIERGVSVDGTEYPIQSGLYFVTKYEETPGHIEIEGSSFPNQKIVLAADDTYRAVIEAFCTEIGKTATFADESEAWLGYQFFATGKQLILNKAERIENILRQKYCILIYERSPKELVFYSANTPQSAWADVIYAGGKFVTVAPSGNHGAGTSTDGLAWEKFSTPVNCVAVAYSPTLDLYVAVGNSVAMSSADGETWTSRTIGAHNWTGVTWDSANTRFVAVATNAIATSADGITWTAEPYTVTAQSAAEANQWQSVCWSPELKLFVAVANSGTNHVMTSPDGTTWTARSAAEANGWRSVCWSPELSLFVAVSQDGTHRVMTSPDGITWTARSAAEARYWRSVCWSPDLGLFVAVENNADNRIMYSSNGTSWTATAGAVAGNWSAITWSTELNLFVVVSTSGQVQTSPNGATWTERTAEASVWQSVCWSPELTLFVAVASSGTNRVMTSPDGITWTARAAAEANTWQSVCWSPELKLFVAVANSGTNRVMTSPDGTTWTAHAATEANGWMSVSWSPELSLFVAVSLGGTNRVMTIEVPRLKATTQTAAVGTNTAARYTGGAWTIETIPAGTYNGITYGNSLYVTVGTNVCATSPDGETWTSRTIPAGTYNKVTWAEELALFIAVGNNVIATSPNGITWTSRTPPAANNWTGVAWDGTTLVIVSSDGDNRTATSTDGITWTLQTASADFSLAYTDGITHSIERGTKEVHFLWRDEAGTTHTEGDTDKPQWNLGYLESTDSPPSTRVDPFYKFRLACVPVRLDITDSDRVHFDPFWTLDPAYPTDAQVLVSEKFNTSKTPAWYQDIESLSLFNSVEGGSLPSTIERVAAYTPLVTTGFDGNLDSTVNNLQALADRVDDLNLGSAPTTTAANDFQVGNGAGAWIKKTLAETITILRTSLDLIFAPIAKGVTNGDSHDHNGGDGAQIAHANLSGVGTNTHATIDTHLASTSNPHSVTAAQAVAIPESGWIERSETWTRTGNYTFTISGDVTATYRKGTKIRYKDGGAFEYGVVISSSYSAPNTTITLATNDNYAMAAATITDKAISFVENPEAFPDWFNYANTIAGSASGSMTWTLTSVIVAKFKVQGATCKYNVFAFGTTGGTASNALRLSAPITWDSVPYVAATQVRDATSGVTQVGSGGCYSGGYLVAYKADPSSNYGLGTGRAMIQSGEFSF